MHFLYDTLGLLPITHQLDSYSLLPTASHTLYKKQHTQFESVIKKILSNQKKKYVLLTLLK